MNKKKKKKTQIDIIYIIIKILNVKLKFKRIEKTLFNVFSLKTRFNLRFEKISYDIFYIISFLRLIKNIITFL